ncbi:MAG: hypothetical protein EHM70_04715 [Chloroflexota bacterium]|nr:MAG: hypothetical protein EHM70_04715 [Chloroflexota bacterium]
MQDKSDMPSPLPNKSYPEERRLASILFADVQGFTALAERLDYETVGDLLKEIWLKLDDIIQVHGGYIDKHIGDAVMAVWGAPYAGENDAERAVAAALDLQNALKDYAETSDQPGAKELQIRVGINTGQVLAGYVGVNNEYTVIGDSVNVANRLEQAAEVGTVLISESTYRLVRGMFQIRRLGPLQFKGKTEPISTYLVEGVLPVEGRMRYHSVGSMETCMVARDAELVTLDNAYQQALKSTTPVPVLITGEAGIGKSRLLMEFTSHLEVDESSFLLLSARALAQTTRVPFYLWKSILYSLFGIRDDDPPEVAQEKFQSGIRMYWGTKTSPISWVEAAHLIGSLTGITWPDSRFLAETDNNPAARLKRAYELTRDLLCRMCTNHRTVLVLDDLQWADSGSLDLLAFLLQPGMFALPLLVLTAARPEFVRQQPRWANVSQMISLTPLPVKAEMVAGAYPDLRSLPNEVLVELITRSDGNPYFLEEMAKGLIKWGIAEGNYTPSEIIERLRTQPPESLRAMLQARLDGLSREARAVALLASVVGRVFWVGAVKAAARPAAGMGTGPLMVMPSSVIDRVIQDSLRQLVRAELAFPRAGTQFSNDQEFIFKHSLLRDVAYSLIPHRYRMQYHLAVAQWMSDRPNPDFKLMAAEHFEQAGVLFEAALQYEQASKVAQTRGFTKEADAMLSRARTLRGKFKENS